jgi:hypothetical protein
LQTLDTANRLLTIGASTSFPNLALATLGYEIVGEKTPFSGFVYNVTTAGDISSADFSIDMYVSGATWSAVPFTVIPLSGAYDHSVVNSATLYGDIYPTDKSANRLGEHLVLFDLAVLKSTLSPAWTSQTFGANAARYYIRVNKLNAGWAVRSLISYLYTVGDTTIFSNLGRRISCGITRSWKTLSVGWSSFFGSGATLPNDQAVWTGTTIQNTYPRSSFAIADSAGAFFYLPSDMDMSSGLEFVLAFISDDNAASQNPFLMTYVHSIIKTGQQMTIAAPGTDPTHQQTTLFSCQPDLTTGMSLVQKHTMLRTSAGNPRSVALSDTDLFIIQMTRRADSNTANLVVMALDVRYVAFIDGNPIG